MNNKSGGIISILLWGMGIVSGWSAGEDVLTKSQYPGGEPLQQAPDFAQWQIDVAYPRAGEVRPLEPGVVAFAPQQPKKISITKTKPIKRVVVTYTNGTTESSWNDGQQTYLMYEGQKPFAISKEVMASMDSSMEFSGGDFPDIMWVSDKNYGGIQMMRGIKCLVFYGGEGLIAWVDVSTRLPVRLTNGGQTKDYTFQSPPTGMIVMPQQISDIVVQEKKIRENNSRKAPKGG